MVTALFVLLFACSEDPTTEPVLDVEDTAADTDPTFETADVDTGDPAVGGPPASTAPRVDVCAGSAEIGWSSSGITVAVGQTDSMTLIGYGAICDVAPVAGMADCWVSSSPACDDELVLPLRLHPGDEATLCVLGVDAADGMVMEQCVISTPWSDAFGAGPMVKVYEE